MKATVTLPESFQKRIVQLGNKQDDIMETVLKAGGEVVLKKVRTNLVSVVGSDTAYPSRATGELVSSLGLSPVQVDSSGCSNIKVGFAEPRDDGSSNAMVANILEYGKSGQPAKPFLKPAKTSSKKECLQVMCDTLEKEIGKL